ncbi:hypothetical protein L5G28_07695 [Gordonia sp. HY285]|uniref:hypothetical protein n=1 Tax=Gordonia liuliyuniae TaxID=2911517 RepID=UPI001F4693CE|nr:hypothetical protein [Gordonia liuliyuniae]MCF8610044.1 hypothetical protein [Gordonia liuliyuniae]
MATYRLDWLVVDTMFVMFLGLAVLGLISFAREYLTRRQHRAQRARPVDRHFIVRDGDLQ